MVQKNYNYLADYVDRLQSMGRYTFAWSELAESLPYSDLAIEKSLNRLVRKGRLVVVQRGFYIIVPPEYSAQGIMPPLLFIDDLMSFLQKPYYVGLMSAAAIHGAAHQQPQEFFVIIPKPSKRPINKRNVRINFLVKNELPTRGIQDRKTDTGKVRVSGPELTAYDLYYYMERLGGLVRCIAVLEELSESFDPQIFVSLVRENPVLAPWQRLGYTLEHLLDKREAADVIFRQIQMQRIYRIPLNPARAKSGYSAQNRWNIIENFSLEDEL
ncbi:type IV toxin-antitoxin system AbiEi family antitoxin [candidate division KSB1 bacterium]|nr:type IV toxin-antitoxin system AbiEi family antitoxin [candidate division KSB1 bacterium]